MGVKAVYSSRTFTFAPCLPLSCWPACWLLLLRDPTTAATTAMEVTEATDTVAMDMVDTAMEHMEAMADTVTPIMVAMATTIMGTDMVTDMGTDTAMEATESTRGALT